MTAATVNASRVALPWYGATILIVEFSASQSGNTLDVTTLDGGQGIKTILMVLESDTGGSGFISSSVSTWSGTTITVGGSAVRNMVVIGR